MTGEGADRARRVLEGPAAATLAAAVDGLADAPGEAWIVGGAVRDAVLGRQVREIDLAIVGDAHGFAASLAGALGGVGTRHDAFGTATVLGSGDLRVDLATARRERYPFPGALPLVEPTEELAEDLARRDFTVNAIAVGLTVGVRGQVLDPFGGLAAIEAGELTILHPGSFLDDPTRILRGLRYAVRLGVFFDDATAAAVDAAVAAHALDAVSGVRILAELRLAAEETTFLEFVAALEPFGLARAIAAPWRPDSGELLLGAIEAAIERLSPLADAPDVPAASARRLARLAGLWLGATSEAEHALAERLPFTAVELATFTGAERAAATLEEVAGAPWPSSVAHALDPLPVPVVLVVGGLAELRRAAGEDEGGDSGPSARIARYLADDRQRRPELDGRDVMRLTGRAPGPLVGRILADLRSALIDGEVAGRDAEERYVLALAARAGDEAEGDEREEDQERDDGRGA
jgi:tRNA nucleotidyltransferase (CCA-adding enzyme)